MLHFEHNFTFHFNNSNSFTNHISLLEHVARCRARVGSRECSRRFADRRRFDCSAARSNWLDRAARLASPLTSPHTRGSCTQSAHATRGQHFNQPASPPLSYAFTLSSSFHSSSSFPLQVLFRSFLFPFCIASTRLSRCSSPPSRFIWLFMLATSIQDFISLCLHFIRRSTRST